MPRDAEAASSSYSFGVPVSGRVGWGPKPKRTGTKQRDPAVAMRNRHCRVAEENGGSVEGMRPSRHTEPSHSVNEGFRERSKPTPGISWGQRKIAGNPPTFGAGGRSALGSAPGNSILKP